MNWKIGHADFSYPANYSQPSYAAQHITRAEVASTISALHADLNSYDLAPGVTFNPRRISEYSATSHTSSYASAANILPPNWVHYWKELEQKFYGHFYCEDNEAELRDLTSVRQGRDESISDYFRVFKDVKE